MPEEKLVSHYNLLLEAYHGIGCKIWELPEQKEPVDLEGIIHKKDADKILPGKVYIAFNPNKVVNYVMEAMRELVVTYKQGKVGLYGFKVEGYEVTIDGIGSKTKHTIGLLEFIEMVKLSPVHNQQLYSNR